MKKTVRFFKGSTEVDNIEQCDYMHIQHTGTKEELEHLVTEFLPKEEVWIESDEPLQRHDRVTLKDRTGREDGFMYRVLSVKGDDLIIQRMTSDPTQWWEGTVKRNEVIAFPPYKHS